MTLSNQRHHKIILHVLRSAPPGMTERDIAWDILRALDKAAHEHSRCPFPPGHAGPCTGDAS